MVLDKKIISRREGLILYWCEGDNPSKRGFKVALTSSDHFILKNFVFWLKEYFFIPKEKIRLRLHLWPSSDELGAKKWWSHKLGLPITSFTKSYIKPKDGKNHKFKHGVCRASIDNKNILEKILKDIKKEFFF